MWTAVRLIFTSLVLTLSLCPAGGRGGFKTWLWNLPCELETWPLSSKRCFPKSKLDLDEFEAWPRRIRNLVFRFEVSNSTLPRPAEAAAGAAPEPPPEAKRQRQDGDGREGDAWVRQLAKTLRITSTLKWKNRELTKTLRIFMPTLKYVRACKDVADY